VLAAPVSWARCRLRLPFERQKRRFSAKNRIRGFVFLGLLTTLVLPLPASGGREEKLNAYQAKAPFLAALSQSC
jgi:hypothetical protein